MEQVKTEPVAMVRVTHSGFGMELATHIAYALPEGDHWLYATPQPAAVDGLVEALRPFALVAEHDIGEDESDFDLFKSLSYNHAPRITVGDIRRAHQALTKIKQP